MALVLSLLGYVVALAGTGFVLFSLANGLLWIAELIEEHSRAAKSFGMRAIYAVIALHLLLWASEGLPVQLTGISVICHLIYLQNFSATWPMISLVSPAFLLSCMAVLLDHFLWFFHFAHRAHLARQRARSYHYSSTERYLRPYTFWETTTFFSLCVWFIPVFLFLSLSANDNALPTTGRDESSRTPAGARTQRTPLLRSALMWMPSSVLPRRFRTGDSIIAPHSPLLNPTSTTLPGTPWSDMGSSRFPSPSPDAVRRSTSSDQLSPQQPPRRTVSMPPVGLGLGSPDVSLGPGMSPRRRFGVERTSVE